MRTEIDVEILSLDAAKRGEGAPYYRELAERANTCDLVHVQHEYSFFGGGPFPPELRVLPAAKRTHFFGFIRALRVPLLITLHELHPAEPQAWRWSNPIRSGASRLLRYVNSLTFGSAHRVITHSDERRAKLIATGVAPHAIRTIPIGVPAPAKRIQRAEAKLRFGLADRFVMTMFGFVSRRKGYDTILDLMPQLPPQALLLIAGGPDPNDRTDYFPGLQARIQDPRLSSRVRITGYLEPDDAATAVAAADLVLAPFEDMGGSSASVLTAIGHGRAVLSWSLIPMRELQSRFASLALVPYGDRSSLSARLLGLIRDPGELTQLESSAIRAAQSYGCDAEAAAVRELYHEVLTSGAHGPWRSSRWKWVDALRSLLRPCTPVPDELAALLLQR